MYSLCVKWYRNWSRLIHLRVEAVIEKFFYTLYCTHMTHVYNMHICILYDISIHGLCLPEIQLLTWPFVLMPGEQMEICSYFWWFCAFREAPPSQDILKGAVAKEIPRITLPETNVAPENGGFPIGISFSKGLFSGVMLVSGSVSLWFAALCFGFDHSSSIMNLLTLFPTITILGPCCL